MLLGFLYTFIGLVIFLVGVKAGFMDVGNMIGHSLASYDNKAILVGLGSILGMLVILTEPAVYILTQQIESVTSGYIKKKTVLITLSIGVAFAVGLAMLRIVVPSIALWHYLLPGFAIALVLTFIVPKIFVGIAFDSGGVASGPMTATFVLAFAQGASDATAHSNILVDSFGVIAMVAMTPLIALQVLGLVYKLKSRKGEDEQTMAGYHLIYCVVNIGDGSKTLKYAKKYGVKGATISMCRGTANSRLLEFFGVSDIQKVIIKMIVEKELASEAIKGISKNMAFDKPHHGIAFSYSIPEFIGSEKIAINRMNTEEVKKSMYKAIHVIVDKGNAEDVIEAANQAGARGGTIINARRSGINEIHKLFSIEIEPEKEEVLIITKSAFKDAIVEAIKNHLNIDEPGNGIMFILNINEAYGLS
jgi:nitrogen regulatory protein PII